MKHPYAIDTDEHRQVVLRLLVPSVIAAVLLQLAVVWILDATDLEPPLWLQALIGPLTAGGFAGLALRQLDTRWWRQPQVRWLLGISTPVLNGRWQVAGTTSFKQGEKDWKAAIAIEQTWSSICVEQETKDSISTSTSASFTVKRSTNRPILTYEYRNDPKAHAPNTMLPHRGFAELRLNRDTDPVSLSGEYYTHPKYRNNYGEMVLTKK